MVRSKIMMLVLLMNAMIAPALSAQSWWDFSPEEIRERIDNRIMDTEGTITVIETVQERWIHQANRQTRVRIYSPHSGNDLPIALFIHGGAWVAGSIDTHDNLARYLSAHANVIVVSVDYTLAPMGKFPLQLEECYDVIEWMNAEAHMFGGDASRLIIVGDSAGGNMAAALCLMSRDRKGPSISLQVLINPATDLRCNGTITPQNDALDNLRWQAYQYVATPEEPNHPYVSPLAANDLSELPPALVLVAEKDDLRRDGEQYAQKLKAANVPTTLFCQMDIGHLAGEGARASLHARESLDEAAREIQSSFGYR